MDELPASARFETQALNALKLSADALERIEGNIERNIQAANVYAIQAVALTNLALLHQGDND